MHTKTMEEADLGEMPSASHAEGSTPSTPTAVDMPTGAMQPGDTMSAAGATPAPPAELGEMPGEPGSTAGAGAVATGSMPEGAMTDAVSAVTGAAPAALIVEMPAGLMESAVGMNAALGNAAADAAAMELSGQWRMSFWVTPRS